MRFDAPLRLYPCPRPASFRCAASPAAGPGAGPGAGPYCEGRHHRGQRGAGLVEVLVALLLLATALATAAAGLLQARRQSQAGLQRLDAVESVADAAERLRLAALAGVAAGPLLVAWQVNAAAALPAAAAGAHVLAGTAEGPLLARRTLQLSWNGAGGPEQRSLPVTLAVTPRGAPGPQGGLP